jgi:tetratricopeptide (TPR) repeat protein
VDERDTSITIDAIRLHRLVREVAAARHGSESRDKLRRSLAAALAVVYPADRNPASWSRCPQLTPHLLSVCETKMADASANAQCADLLNRAGLYFHHRAAYSEARPLHERARAIYENVLGPEHPDTATSVSNLATVLWDLGDRAGALPLFEHALAIREKVLGPEHPDTAESVNFLAHVLHDQGDFAGARPLVERALAIDEKCLT